MRATFWTALILLIGLSVSGCGQVSMYVLDQKELVKVKAGDVITAKFDGYLLSNRAIQRVMKTDIEEIKVK